MRVISHIVAPTPGHPYLVSAPTENVSPGNRSTLRQTTTHPPTHSEPRKHERNTRWCTTKAAVTRGDLGRLCSRHSTRLLARYYFHNLLHGLQRRLSCTVVLHDVYLVVIRGTDEAFLHGRRPSLWVVAPGQARKLFRRPRGTVVTYVALKAAVFLYRCWRGGCCCAETDVATVTRVTDQSGWVCPVCARWTLF